ncbi:TetR/AcrR family transcriptional regulator [Mycoplasmatota bacterium WC44]
MYKKPKTKKGIREKSIILETSIELINSQGYGNTTIKDICSAANITNGNFYHYFESKSDIILNYVELESEDIFNKYKTLTDLTYKEKLLYMLKIQCDYLEFKGQKFLETYISLIFTKRKNFDQLLQYSFYKIFEECIQNGISSNEFKCAESPEDIIEILNSTFSGLIVRWTTLDDNSSPYEFIYIRLKKLIDLLLVTI